MSPASWWRRTVDSWRVRDVRPRNRNSRSGHFPLRGEGLEPRLALSANAVWNDTSQLTLSFAPDGTDVGGEPSRLYDTFQQFGEPHEWKETILRAFQQWVEPTRANVGVVADEGLPLGTAGPRTQDPRFGDIRIAARPLSEEVLAIGVAQDAIVGGTWAGDVVFNSNAAFDSLEDLFGVTLHEAGHVLGLSHSDDPLSPMYVHGLPEYTELTAGDLQRIQEIQGERLPDEYEGDAGNETMSTAVPLALSHQGTGQPQPPILVYADLTTAGDVDYFSLPANHRAAAPVTVRLQSKAISMLAPRVRILTEDGAEVASSSSTQAGGATLLLRMDELNPGERYFIEVTAARPDTFAVGAYTLVVTYEGLPPVNGQRIEEAIVRRERELNSEQVQSLMTEERQFYNRDAQTDDDVTQARPLVRRREYTSSTRYEAVASISDAADKDYYRFETDDFEDGDPLVLHLTVHSLDPGGLIPRAVVLNQDREAMAAEVLVNGQGEFVMQAALQPNQVYFVCVDAAGPETPFVAGNYRLTLELVDEWFPLETYLAATIEPSTPAVAQTLYVAQTQLLHLALEVSPPTAPARQLLVAQVLDSQGEVLAQWASAAGETRTAPSLLLAPGEYRVQLFLADLDGVPSTAMALRLRGITFSDPLGVDPIDPTEDPVFVCPGEEDVFCYPGGIVSEDPILWDEFLDTLPELPNLTLPELIDLLLADWWSWYWVEQEQNGPALTIGDDYALYSGQTLIVDAAQGVLANDLDPESGPIAAVLVTDVEHGRLVLNPDGSFTYIPDPAFVGTDAFQYQAYDFATESTPATVWLEVAGPANTVGDFNDDLEVDAADLQLFCDALRSGQPDPIYDLSADEMVDHTDLLFLVQDLLGTEIGDANLDGQFDSSDFVEVFQSGWYESNLPGRADWSTGDWNCDGWFNSSDIVFAFQQGGYELATAAPASLAAVAELAMADTPVIWPDDDDPRWK